jgi:hypothetical protein
MALIPYALSWIGGLAVGVKVTLPPPPLVVVKV